MMRQRIIGLVISLASIAVLYWTWFDVRSSGSYYLKAAAFAPLGIIGGLVLVIFPKFAGKPETTREKVIVFSVFAVGVLLGLYNWYLIDPTGFKF